MNAVLTQVPVCYKALISPRGITHIRVQTLQSMLTTKGEVKKIYMEVTLLDRIT